MKNIQILILSLFALLLFFQLSCTKEGGNIKPENNANESTGISDKNARIAAGVTADAVSTTSGTCGSTISDSYTGNGGYLYSSKQINVSCVAPGATITLTLNSSEFPNQFTVKDPNGNTVASSTSVVCSNGWLGAATYMGPWSTATSCIYRTPSGGLQAPSTAQLSFTKGSFNTYYLEVRASLPPVNNQNGTTNLPQQDTWHVGISCTCTTTSCSNSCGKTLSGTYTGNGGYLYTSKIIDVTPCPGQTINSVTLTLNSSEFPNQFTVKDPNGNTVASSTSVVCSNGWLGAATYMGPWSTATSCIYRTPSGGLQAPSTGQLSFTRVYNTYYLEVRTSLPPSSNQDGTTNLPQQDTWYVGVTCH